MKQVGGLRSYVLTFSTDPDRPGPPPRRGKQMFTSVCRSILDLNHGSTIFFTHTALLPWRVPFTGFIFPFPIKAPVLICGPSRLQPEAGSTGVIDVH